MPPPPPPPPAPAAASIPKPQPGKQALLSDICKGTKLKPAKAKMNDRSAPIIEGSKTSSAGSGPKTAVMPPKAGGPMGRRLSAPATPMTKPPSFGSGAGGPPPPPGRRQSESTAVPPAPMKINSTPKPPANGHATMPPKMGSAPNMRSNGPPPPPANTKLNGSSIGSTRSTPAMPPPTSRSAAPAPPPIRDAGRKPPMVGKLTTGLVATGAPPPPPPGRSSVGTVNRKAPPIPHK